MEAAPAIVPGTPDVARIIGVRDDSEERERQTRRRSTSAAFPTRLRATRHDVQIAAAATSHRIDPLFLRAIIETESAHAPRAVSRVGARGLMQIMPATGRDLGIETSALFDPATNIDAGARLLKRLQRRYGRDFDLILSAYNAGEGAVARYGNRIPPYRETQNYVRTVMARYNRYRQAGLFH